MDSIEQKDGINVEKKTDGRSRIDCIIKQSLPTSFFCSTIICQADYKTLRSPL